MKKESGNVDKWFQVREFWITAVFIAFTLLLGSLEVPPFSSTSSGLLNSIIVAFLEFTVGVAIFIARKVSSELDAFQRHSNAEFSRLQQAMSSDNELIRILHRLNDPEVSQEILKTVSYLERVPKTQLLYSMLKKDIQVKALELSNITSAEEFYLSKPGDYTPIQERLQNYLETLTEGCSYVTVSNLKFWSGEEISHPADFLRFNVDCAQKRGVSFERVFLLNNKRFSDLKDDEKYILRDHLAATRECSDKVRTYVVESDKTFSADMRRFGNFSVWLARDGSPQLLLNMIYDDKGHFVRLEATKKTALITTFYKRFRDLREQAEPIDTYLSRNQAV